MNIEEYAELLDRKEWKNKRESILKRDDYTCQKCGRRGFSFRSFKISGYSELNNLMKGWTIEDVPVVEYFKKIEWEGDEYFPMLSVEKKSYRNNRKLISFYINDSDKNKFSFIIDDESHFYPCYIKYEQNELKIDNKETGSSFFVDLIAFKLRRTTFTLSCNYIKIFEDKGDISILIADKLFVFRTSKYGIFRYRAMNFVTLHVHHRYYIEDRCPWEYDDDILITLCSDCHAEVHNLETTPLLSETGRVIYSDLPICDRCGGRGELPQYKYYMNGICFKCHGTGVIFKD